MRFFPAPAGWWWRSTAPGYKPWSWTGTPPKPNFRLPVNPALLVTNNRINFRLVGLADRACPNPLDKRVWLTVDPSSAIEYRADRLPLASDLEMPAGAVLRPHLAKPPGPASGAAR